MKKNILVFGANSFVAKAFLRDYAGQYDLHPVYRVAPEGALALDFNDAGSVEAFARQISFEIHAIVFFQGINPSMGVKDITEEHFLKMMRVNLSTPVLLIAALQPRMSADASIVFISSVAKRKGSYDPSYAAAKSGLTGLMLSLANGYPSQRFNMVSLGLVEGSPVFAGMTDDFRARHASRMQNREFVKAENVSQVISLLIDNVNLNKTDIAVDGGYN